LKFNIPSWGCQIKVTPETGMELSDEFEITVEDCIDTEE
jgi:hypothetical protein